MDRIGAIGCVGTAQARTGAERRDPAAARALLVLDGGRAEAPRMPPSPTSARAAAGFLAQLLVAAEPALRPSRLERTRAAAECYATAARRLA